MAEREWRTRLEKRQPQRSVFEFISMVSTMRKTIEGIENLKEAGRLISMGIPLEIYPNHLSHADTTVLVRELRKKIKKIDDKLSFIIGEVLLRNFITRNSRGYRGVAIPSGRIEAITDEEKRIRRERREMGFAAAEEDLKAGYAIVNYAEGTRSRGIGMARAKDGIARYLYLVPGIHILPVGVWGTEKTLPSDSKVPIPRVWSKVGMKFGRPFAVSELETEVRASITSHHLPEEELHERMVNSLMYRIAELLPDEYQGYYPLHKT